jgi:hypothetical protein
MTILFIITGILLLIVLFGKISLSFRFRKQVAALYANSEIGSEIVYSSSQLDGLPLPVQRYFKYALKDGQPYISTVRLKHTGLFKASLKKNFGSIAGEQHFSSDLPQFIWKGTTPLFTARDSYIAGIGNLNVALFGIFPVVNGHGSTFDEGELQRWLAESVWFPTNLLPSEKVHWEAINENAAKLSFSYKAISFHYLVTFNGAGQITVMETQRYMTKKKRGTWICKMSDYKETNNVKIPFSAEALWKLQAGDFSYAKFKIEKIEYNIPESF